MQYKVILHKNRVISCMADFLDEIKEHHKQEVIAKFLRRYSKFIIAGALLIIMISAVWVYMDYRKAQRQSKFGVEFIQALSNNDHAKLKKISSEKAGGFSDVAGLIYAQILEGEKKFQESASVYQSLYQESSFAEIRNYALYKYGMISLNLKDGSAQQNYMRYYAKKTDSAFGGITSLVNIVVNLLSNNKVAAETEILKLKNDQNLDSELTTLVNVVSNSNE